MARHNVSLMRGGPVFRLLARSGMLRRCRSPAPLIAALLLAVAWLPLVVAATLDRTLLPGRVVIPLLGDAAIHARLLVVVPLLVLAAAPADRLLRAAINHFGRAGLIRDRQRGRFGQLLARTHALRDSHLPELLCLAVAMLPALASAPVLTEIPHVSSWHTGIDGHLSFAGLWAWWVSMPLFRFVALMWLWRFLLWTLLLWRVSRLDLDLRAPHPDGRGGLAFLGLAQQRFSVLALAGGIVLSGTCINHFTYAGQSLMDVRYLLAGYVVGVSLFLMSPLLLLVPPLLRAKRGALSRYAALGHVAVRRFDQSWRKNTGKDDPSLLDSPQPSALADFGAVYANLAGMSVIPMTRGNLLWMIQCAAAPLLPLVFFAMSLDDLVRRLFSMLA